MDDFYTFVTMFFALLAVSAHMFAPDVPNFVPYSA